MSRIDRVNVGIAKAEAEGFKFHGTFTGEYTEKVKELKASGLDVRYWYTRVNDGKEWVAYVRPFKKKDTKSVSKPQVNFDQMTSKQLQALCKEKKIAGYSKMTKDQMIKALS